MRDPDAAGAEARSVVGAEETRSGRDEFLQSGRSVA
jgi:hypothetical protein